MKLLNIAVDGTAGSGKTSTMEIVAKKLNCKLIDTGLMYRGLTKHCLEKGIDFNNKEDVIKELKRFNFSYKGSNFYLDNKDITRTLSDIEVVNNVSKVASITEVRSFMVEQQKKLGNKDKVIMLGRDITTVVLPNAWMKFYFDCSIESRAQRRFKQNENKNVIPNNYDDIYNKIKERDFLDKNRETGPLSISTDSIIIDSSDLTLEETVDLVLSKIEKNR